MVHLLFTFSIFTPSHSSYFIPCHHSLVYLLQITHTFVFGFLLINPPTVHMPRRLVSIDLYGTRGHSDISQTFYKHKGRRASARRG